MKHAALTTCLLAIAATCATGSALAESRITAVPSTTTSLTTTARLNFSIVVPRILYLRVGDLGATINTVNFAVGLGGSLTGLPVSDTVFNDPLPVGVGTVSAGDDSGASDGQIPVQLWTNNGTSQLTCNGAPLSSGSNTIPLSEVTVTSSGGGSLAHPGPNLGCVSAARGGAGTNNLTDTWTFAYSPATLPAAGSYTTTITYTASQP